MAYLLLRVCAVHRHQGNLECCAAHTTFDPNSDGNADGEGLYFYPGADGPVSSIRYENLRDGLEDVELIRMAQRGATVATLVEIKKIVASVITAMPRANHTEDPAVLAAARAQLAAIILGNHERPRDEASATVF